MGLDFIGLTLYDGAGMMVKKESGIRSLRSLVNEKICVLSNGTTAAAVTRFFENLDEPIETISYGDEDSALAAYECGACIGLANDKTRLIGQRLLIG